MAVTVRFCCVFFISLLLARVAQGDNGFAPYYVISGKGGGCPSQLEMERARQNIEKYIKNKITLFENCGPGEWVRVAHLNMSDPSQQCPPDWMEYNSSELTCGRQYQIGILCSSVNYTSNGSWYRKVCGQVIGYQLGSTDVFDNQTLGIDSAYVDGVSITHGTPRTHIWTYAAGVYNNKTSIFDCPCSLEGNYSFTPQTPPPYVGDDYYCESGNPSNEPKFLKSLTDSNDLLWDGKQCEGQCCSNGKTPPWFSVDLPNPTSDDIEVRLCDTDNIKGEDTPIKQLELYIQV